jgi:anti-sigma B factor antagonist
MEFEEDTKQNVYVVALHGKLIAQSEIQELQSHFRYLREKKIRRVVLNLEFLDWMGSLGLGALISCLTTMRNAGGDLRLSNLNMKLKSLMKITKLDRVFQTFDSVDVAIQSFDTIAH